MNRTEKQDKCPKYLVSISDYGPLLEKKTEKLWQALGIPKADQYCFRKEYFNNASPKIIDAIKTQMKLLKKYRNRTVSVLQQIEQREALLTELDGFLRNESMDLAEFAAEVPNKLIRLRDATIAVLKGIKSWRKLMWNPHPFIWNSINYIEKIGKDYENLLDSVMFVKLQIFVADFVFFIPQSEAIPILEPTDEDEVYQSIASQLIPTNHLPFEYKDFLTSIGKWRK